MEKPKHVAVVLLSFFVFLLLSNADVQVVGSDITPQPVKTQAALRREFNGFGLLPVKEVHLEPRETIYLVPGGHSIGVLLRSKGVMIVGFSPVIVSQDQVVYPAKEEGIEIGDLLLAVNDVEAESDEQVRDLIAQGSKAGQPIRFKLRRNQKEFTCQVLPQYCTETKSYRIGLFVRDNAGGVGTLTFYHAGTGIYGALGHVIANGQSNDPIGIRQGRILLARVEDIHPGNAGLPGEKIGAFVNNTDFGNVEKNSTCGIYGQLSKPLTNPGFPEPLAAAYYHQISAGPAKILTVIEGEEIKAFDVEIQRLLPGRPDGKNMIIKITDQELLAKTGGIVQGMSGSPIIQNNMIVGAVTHVFVNDPTRGYGVFIENMLIESGILSAVEETLDKKSEVFLLLNPMMWKKFKKITKNYRMGSRNYFPFVEMSF